MRQFVHLQSNSMILHKFFTKIAITQPRIVQIPKFWCLRSSTNIWPANGNINSIPKVKKEWSRGEQRFKTCKNRPVFCIEKIKICIFSKFCLVLISKPIVRVSWYTIQQKYVENLAEEFFFIGSCSRQAWSQTINFPLQTTFPFVV